MRCPSSKILVCNAHSVPPKPRLAIPVLYSTGRELEVLEMCTQQHAPQPHAFTPKGVDAAFSSIFVYRDHRMACGVGNATIATGHFHSVLPGAHRSRGQHLRGTQTLIVSQPPGKDVDFLRQERLEFGNAVRQIHRAMANGEDKDRFGRAVGNDPVLLDAVEK